jgi:hypothetical protein
MKFKSILIGFALIILIQGCSTTRGIEVLTKQVERTPLSLPLPPPEVMEEVRIIVITPENQTEVFQRLIDNKIDPAIFGYSDEDWELVEKNNARLRYHILKLRQVILAYKEYYEPNAEIKAEIRKEQEALVEEEEKFKMSSLFSGSAVSNLFGINDSE